MSNEIEAIIGCPGCKVDLWQVNRVPLDNNGHFEHQLAKIGEHDSDHLTHTDCGGILQRKPADGWG